MVHILYCYSYMERQYCFLYSGEAYLMSQKAASCGLYYNGCNGELLTEYRTITGSDSIISRLISSNYKIRYEKFKS